MYDDTLKDKIIYIINIIIKNILKINSDICIFGRKRIRVGVMAFTCTSLSISSHVYASGAYKNFAERMCY